MLALLDGVANTTTDSSLTTKDPPIHISLATGATSTAPRTIGGTNPPPGMLVVGVTTKPNQVDPALRRKGEAGLGGGCWPA